MSTNLHTNVSSSACLLSHHRFDIFSHNKTVGGEGGDGGEERFNTFLPPHLKNKQTRKEKTPQECPHSEHFQLTEKGRDKDSYGTRKNRHLLIKIGCLKCDQNILMMSRAYAKVGSWTRVGHCHKDKRKFRLHLVYVQAHD